MVERKGQLASIEMILIVAVVMITTIPLGIWTIHGLNQKWDEGTKLQEATLLRDAIKTVSNLGPGNSISVSSLNGYSIVDNHLLYDDVIDIPLLPSLGDQVASEGIIEVINMGGGVFFGNAPKIDSIDSNDKSRIIILGKHFSEDTVVLIDDVEVDSNFLSENEINFKLKNSGDFDVQLVRTVGDKELLSNILNLNGGGPVQKPKKEKK